MFAKMSTIKVINFLIFSLKQTSYCIYQNILPQSVALTSCPRLLSHSQYSNVPLKIAEALVTGTHYYLI